jgi:hypothetical protein
VLPARSQERKGGKGSGSFTPRLSPSKTTHTQRKLDLRDVEEVAEPKGKSSSKKAIKETAKTAGVPDAATTPDPSKVPPA